MREKQEVARVGTHSHQRGARLEIEDVAQAMSVGGGEGTEGAIRERLASQGVGVYDFGLRDIVGIVVGDELGKRKIVVDGWERGVG